MRSFISFLLTLLLLALRADGIELDLCCPSGEILSEVGCTKHQADIPPFIAQWTSGGKNELTFQSGPKFQCSKSTEEAVILELLFGPIEARIDQSTGSLHVGNGTEDKVLFSSGDYCALYSNIFSEEIYTTYWVCYAEETPVEADQRKLTGIIYPTAILISSVFTFVTIIFYLTVGSLRKTLFAKITLAFLLNVFICYFLLAIVYNFLLSDNHRDFLGSNTCKVLGYIIHHTFIAFFFWMSAMAFNIAKSLSTMKVVRNSKSSFKSLLVYFLYAQGIPILFTVFTVLMDTMKPGDAPLPNVGEFSCFIGSPYEEDQSFFKSSEFLYYYLIVLVIITFNILCFSVTTFNLSRHWQAMKDIQTTSDSDGLVEHLTIIIKLSVIMGVPWILDVISAGLQYRLGSQIFSLRVALDILNLLTGILIFVSLICKPSVWSQIKASYSGTEERRNLSNGSTRTSSTSFKKQSQAQMSNGGHV